MLYLDKFLEIEKKFNLYEDTIDGVNYWVYARAGIWDNIILKDYLGVGTAHDVEKRKLVKQFQIYLAMLLISIKRKGNMRSDVCIINHPRRVNQGDYYECIYTDELATKIKNSIVLEFPYQMKHLKPTKTNNLYYMDEIILRKVLGVILYRTFFKKKAIKIKEAVEDKTTKVFEYIEREYDIRINREGIVKHIVQEVICYKSSIETIQKIIRRINPKVVVEVVSYDPNCMMINEVCKEMGITTIELQHGTVDEHIAYSYAEESNVKQFPDKFFTYSSFWRQYLRLPIEDENIVCTGYPYFERIRNTINKITRFDDNKINIIFISQGTIGKKLSELADELSQKLDLEKYRIIFKLHPGEVANWRKKYPALINEEIVVEDGNSYSLYEYFATCHIQIGVYSAALFEGLGFGLSTYIYQIEMSEHMYMLCEAGYATYFNDCDEILTYISKTPRDKVCDASFWEKNALEKMIININKSL